MLFIHQELASSQGSYTSFCDITEGMSCDVVLGSPYAAFLGIPVGGWALLSYVVSAFLALYLMRGSAQNRFRAATALVALTGAMLAAAIYFFLVSSLALGVLCPMCLSMDAVNIALFLLALAIFRLQAKEDRGGFEARNSLLVASVAGLVALLGLAWVQASPGPTGPLTLEQIKEQMPRFYADYLSSPVVQVPFADEDVPGDTPITIIEFSDYECPHCRRAFFEMAALAEKYPQDLRIIHRNFPLSSACNPAIESAGHAHACAAAIASECAVLQGKGPALSRLMFTNQNVLSDENILSYAQQAGLDMPAFRQCQQGPEAAAAVSRDVQAAIDAGVKATPTLFINGRRIQGGFSQARHWVYALTIEKARLGQSASPENPDS